MIHLTNDKDKKVIRKKDVVKSKTIKINEKILLILQKI